MLRKLSAAGLVGMTHPDSMINFGAKSALVKLNKTKLVPEDTYVYYDVAHFKWISNAIAILNKILIVLNVIFVIVNIIIKVSMIGITLAVNVFTKNKVQFIKYNSNTV